MATGRPPPPGRRSRDEGTSFWLRDDPSRRSAWLLVADAARLGLAIQDAGHSLDARGDMERAIDRYVSHGSPADRAHRHLEQRRAALLYPPLPDFESLRAGLDRVRMLWRDWADRWAADFNALCKQRGFLPDSRLQQRHDLRRGREAPRAGIGDDRVLRRRRLPLRDGGGVLRDALRHSGDDADALGPARGAADRDRGGHERARAGRRPGQAPPGDLGRGRPRVLDGRVPRLRSGEPQAGDARPGRRADLPPAHARGRRDPRGHEPQAIDRPGQARRRPQQRDRPGRRAGRRPRRVRPW